MFNYNLLIALYTLAVSTVLYIYLHKKTMISLHFLYKDNLLVFLIVFLIYFLIEIGIYISLILIPVLVVIFAFAFTMFRFWRTPRRKINAKQNEIISPADGNIIYIKKIKTGEVPISVKGKNLSDLSELSKTDLLKTPCWLIGINMTPFDVHKNCSPIDGKVRLVKHFSGKFLSLKDPNSESENERCTYIIQNKYLQIGVIQIASKRVRRIDFYVDENQSIEQGNWIGMIRFGSQVDVILPIKCRVRVSIGQKVYAIKTIIADY